MRLKTATHGNGVISTLDYRNDNLVNKIATNGGATGVGDYSYDYDPNKNKTSETITGPLDDYGFGNGNGAATVYDEEDRLTTWGRSDGELDRTWELSLVGRWNSLTEDDGTAIQTKALAHTRGHEITSFGGAEVEHDAKGNRTLDQDGHSFIWDFDNRLSQATPLNGERNIFFTYDALGRRVSKRTRGNGSNGDDGAIYVCSGKQVVCEYFLRGRGAPRVIDSALLTQRYVYGSYVDEVILKDGEFTDETDSGILYYHRNQQYSITALTDSDGEVAERYAYTAVSVHDRRSDNGVD